MFSLLSSPPDSLQLTWDSLAGTFSLVYRCLLPEIKIPYTNLIGKIAVITGANSGIGYVLARSLAERNATVYLACRSRERGEKAIQDILDTVANANSNNVHVMEHDTSSLESVRAFASRLTLQSHNQGIDILIHNAGCVGTTKDKQVTDEGLGTIYTTNFLGSFLLTSLLEKHLNPCGRVIFTSSTGQYAAKPDRIFSLPKLAPTSDTLPNSALYSDIKSFQVAFARMLQDRFDRNCPDKRLSSHSFTPG